MNRKTLKDFKSTILSDKLLIIGTILIAVLSYGFAVTHFSIGIDDTAAAHYVHSIEKGSLIQQGRLLPIVIDYLTGLIDFIPFLNDFIGAALFWLSSLVFCYLFEYISNKRFSSLSCLVFAGIYLSFPIINEKFIYNLDVITTMLSYLFISLSALCAYQAVFENNKKQYLPAFVFCMAGISAYESFIMLYVCVVFSIFFIKAAADKNYKLKYNDVILKGARLAAILVFAFILYYIIVFAAQSATDQPPYIRINLFNTDLSFIDCMKQIAKDLFNFDCVSVVVFWSAAAVGLIIGIYYSIKRKSLLTFLCFLGFFTMNFPIHILAAHFFYRTALTFCYFAAVIGLLVMKLSERFTPTKRIACVLAFLLIIVQVRDINLMFYNDYKRYQKETFVVHTIATDLQANYDVTKPIVFTNTGTDVSYLNAKAKGSQINGLSFIFCGLGSFRDPGAHEIFELFSLNGYDFLVEPTDEQAMEAKEISKTMPCWPKKGSIKECDEYIIINFTSIQY